MKAAAAASLLLALASCQPPSFPLDLVVRDGTLLFWTRVEHKWFIWPRRPDDEEVCGIDVWTGREWAWRVQLTPCRKGALPIAYGASGAGFRTSVPAKPLRPGVTYVARIDTEWEGWAKFRLNERRRLQVEDASFEDDPDQQAFAERRDKRIADLQATGMPVEQAVEVWRSELEASGKK